MLVAEVDFVSHQIPPEPKGVLTRRPPADVTDIEHLLGHSRELYPTIRHHSRTFRQQTPKGTPVPTDYPLLDVDAVAEVAEVKPSTIRYYHKMKQMPSADVYFGRSPVWKKETIDAWIESRRKP